MARINDGQWVVQGHKRYALKDRPYPGIVATGNDQDSVRGIVCEGLSPADVKRLDLYEGDVRYIAPEFGYNRCDMSHWCLLPGIQA